MVSINPPPVKSIPDMNHTAQTTPRIISPATITTYWFGPPADDAVMAQNQRRLWWSKDPAVDYEIRRRFAPHVMAAASGKYTAWADAAQGRLALILLFDQFPRNLYRNSPRAFAYDHLARELALAGIAAGIDRQLRPIERVFFYLPLEHAESATHQEHCVRLYEQLLAALPPAWHDTFAGYLRFAERHRNIIRRFGRFPHRNRILGRVSTPEEAAFLQQPGSSF